MPEIKKKIIVTNKSALYDKYEHGSDREQIKEVLERLKSFDMGRGIDTKVIYLDDETEMGKNTVKVVTSEKQNKRAVDDVYGRYKPDYLVILGAYDIVPFQSLENPAYPSMSTNILKYIPSDLPYACDAGYSNKVDDFIMPNRIVSRIPDIPGNAEMGLPVLLNSIGNIMRMRTRKPEKYRKLWAACTMKRRMPMAMSLSRMFPPPLDPKYVVCPPGGHPWSADNYSSLTHFHILHGIKKTNRLIGEDTHIPPNHPLAVRSDHVDGNITLGTIVLERSCYGGKLYDPVKTRTPPHTLPLAAMYMRSGAAAMLGSSVENFSYESGMLLGDYLVTAFFNELNNTSVGEAFLKARQSVVRDGRIAYLCDKTMFGAFILYGDASVVPMSDALPADDDEISTMLLCANSCDASHYKEAAERLEISAEYIGQEVTGEIPENVQNAVLEYLKGAGAEKTGAIICNTVIKDGVPIPDKLRFTVNAIVDGVEFWFVFDTPGEPVTFVEKYSIL